MKKEGITLKVCEAHQRDVGYGRAGIDQKTREHLGLSLDGVVEIEGKKTTVAVISSLHPGDEKRNVIRIDNFTRKNAGARIGDEVKIRWAESKDAEMVFLTPVRETDRIRTQRSGIERVIKKGLLKRPVTRGDYILAPGIGFNPFLFGVVRTEPGGVVAIGDETTVRLVGVEWWFDAILDDVSDHSRLEGVKISEDVITGEKLVPYCKICLSKSKEYEPEKWGFEVEHGTYYTCDKYGHKYGKGFEIEYETLYTCDKYGHKYGEKEGGQKDVEKQNC